ncbi:TraR/DksA family transcriptional regulator [Colwellia psychrerythraea]|uniref:Transcriptional regulator, TraR/DksA family n=1 Tax=Colwellia psychrerythraea TaxID=28229 RepID=A0A099L3L9_COLPS|nr:TraR/DksA family transcriptional regulator [Colwellia psychrerythraea]KGJ96737.1 transcriptional regulator, TraR/DksA family [Colwellia psychrerythraea]
MPNKEITILLENKQAQLIKRIAAIEADFHKGRSADFSEQATETENDGVLDEIHHEAKLELTLVQSALDRIAGGLYGHCVECDEPINPDRLSALPYTIKCINCAL